MKNSDLRKLVGVLLDDRTISYDDNRDFDVNEINERCKKYPNEDILVIVPNTKGLTPSMINALNDHVYIRVTGVFDDLRVTTQQGISFVNNQDRKSAVDFYFSTVIYSKTELIEILNEINKIESNMNSNWSDIQKLVYLYKTLKMKITYDPKFESKSDKEVRSLRGLITKETVCVGYSLILAELLDRQGITCLFVGGNKHAWNIVEIEGKLYGVDLTYENKKFREGIQDSYKYLGQNPVIFNKSHKPSKYDPYADCHNKLDKLDENMIKFIASTVVSEEEYEKISFRCQRENKEEFVLIQMGTKVINNEIYYIYYYDRIHGDKVANNPLILASKESISKYVDNVNFKRTNILTSDDIVNKVFGKGNILNSLERNSAYLGEIVSYQGTTSTINVLQKDEKDMELFKESPKVYPREDGSIIVLEKEQKFPIKLGNSSAYSYNIYDVQYQDNKPVLRKRRIYSDTDLLHNNNEKIQNKLLREDSLNYAIRNNCGYIGFINEIGEISHNEELMKYFSSREKITISDLEKAKRR